MSITVWLAAGGLVGWAGHYRTQLRAAAIAFDVVVALLGASCVDVACVPNTERVKVALKGGAKEARVPLAPSRRRTLPGD